VSKLARSALIFSGVLVALAYATPTLVVLIHALVPLVLVGGTVVTVLQLVRYFTQR
jgi:hypothetical protein